MLHTPLTVHKRERQGIAILDVTGEITGAGEDALLAPLEEALAKSSTVLLNLSEVTYINSSGISLLIRMLIRCGTAGCTLCGYGLTDYFAELFEITRLDRYITVWPDEPSALAAAESPSPTR